ncbi:hypothetical protein [Marinicauda sp. Alg238-R41]|nr:hypothetical protein [Marinicauda sp. Alg238-R41]
MSQNFIAVQAFSLGRDLLSDAGKDRLQAFPAGPARETLRQGMDLV